MRKLFLAAFASFLFAHVGLSDTYVWEDYDDFSGSSLDSSKWEAGYFSGGQVATVSGGVATLSGSGYTGSDVENVPSIWQDAASQSTGQSNSGLFVTSTEIYGIEVEVSIPQSGNSQNVGFIVETHSADGSTYNGIELAWRENGLNWSYENENPSTAQILELSQEADFDTSYTLSVIHTGSRMELHINGTRVANLNSNFTPNHWLIGSFNDEGKTFTVPIDNVRVLRRSTSETLDGSTLFLDSDDPVTLTLAFENGTVTSTFEDGGEDSGTGTVDQYDYIIVDQNRFSFTDTTKLDGTYITFDQSTGRGKLFDFKSDGQIDESGTWEFSFQSSDLAVRPRSIWASRDLVYLQTPSGLTEIEGAGEIDFGAELIEHPSVTQLNLSVNGSSYDLRQQEAPNGFRTRFEYDSGYGELFDLESASNSDWTAYANQTTFAFSLTVDGSEYSYSHNLPAESELPQPVNISVNGNYTWKKDTEGYDYVEILKNDSYQFSWDTFSSTDSKDYIVVHLQELVGDDDVQVMPEVVLDAGETSYTVDGSYFEAGKKYAFYVELMNVTEQQNPSGFTHASGSDTTQPLLQTTARMVTALDLVVIEEKVVVSTPNGLPVVVQVGDEYNWNDSLDGVMLWGVWQDDDSNEWVIVTANYIDGKQKGAFGSHSSLPAELDVDHPYTINGDIIDVTETNGHQYYQVTSVDNDTIYAVDDDTFPLTEPSWWFVTKVAAEEFYNSKLHYAPSSLVGKTIHIPEEGYDSNYYFTEDEAYYMVPLSSGRVDGISYSYVANTSTTATLTLARNEPGDVIHQISFSSPTSADSNWTDVESNVTDSASLEILTENYLPSSLAGWTYKGSSMNDTFYFVDEGHAVFYDASDSNFSNRELSNITYTWEQVGPRIGKLTTSLSEETLLFFESNTSGFFDWEETGSDDGNSGQFDLYYYSVGKALESLVGSSITMGDTTYVFTSLSTVTVHGPSGTSSQEYSYLRENEDEALLFIESSLHKLDFYDHQYGRIIEGGSGYFAIHQNWATKGWVWQDHYPWAYSNNMQDWFYQVLFINDDNESDMAHYQVWDNQWSIPSELHYFGESNFSSADAYSWEVYDDFNGTELNSSKWDVAWWDGGTAPSIDQLNNRVEFTKGSSYEANLSDLMNIPNPNAESEYSRGYSSTSGNAPSSLADLVVFVAETAVYSNGSTDYYGEDEIYFSNTHRSRWDWDENRTVTDPYTYAKTGSDTATITINKSGATYTAQLTFTSPTEGTGNWTDYENGQTETGTLTFKIEYSPHSLLEFSQSDEIEGIEFELMIPSNAPDQTCIGLYAVDYNKMFNAQTEVDEIQSMKFNMDLCFSSGSLTMEFFHKDSTTNEDVEVYRTANLEEYQKVSFIYEEGYLAFYHNQELVGKYAFERENEKFVIRAQNEQNLGFSTYLSNVRVLRKKSYPQGWMWMDYYPWAYSYESNSWLYFQLAKDADGQPGMIYWDTATKDWDIYHPSLSPEQVEDQKSATKLLNQE